MSGILAGLELLSHIRNARDAKNGLLDTAATVRDGLDEKQKKIIKNYDKLDGPQKVALLASADQIHQRLLAAKKERRVQKVTLAMDIVGIAEFASSFSVILPPPANFVTVVSDVVLASLGGKSATEKAAYAESLSDPVELLIDTAHKFLVGLIAENLTYPQMQRTFNQFYALNESICTDYDVTPEEQERIDILNKTVLSSIDAFHKKIADHYERRHGSSGIYIYKPSERINLEPFGDKPISFEKLVDNLTDRRAADAIKWKSKAVSEKITRGAKGLGFTSGVLALIPGAQPFALVAALGSASVWGAGMAKNLARKLESLKKEEIFEAGMAWEINNHKSDPDVRGLLNIANSKTRSTTDSARALKQLHNLIRNKIAASYIEIPEGKKVSDFMNKDDMNYLMLIHVTAHQEEIEAFKMTVPEVSERAIVTRNPLSVALPRKDAVHEVFNPAVIGTQGFGPLVGDDFVTRLKNSTVSRKTHGEAVWDAIHEFEESKDVPAVKAEETYTPASSHWRTFIQTHIDERERGRSVSPVVTAVASSPTKSQAEVIEEVISAETVAKAPAPIKPITVPARVKRAAALAVRRRAKTPETPSSIASSVAISPVASPEPIIHTTRFVEASGWGVSASGSLVRPQPRSMTAATPFTMPPIVTKDAEIVGTKASKEVEKWPAQYATDLKVIIPTKLKDTVKRAPARPGAFMFERVSKPGTSATIFAQKHGNTAMPPAADSAPDQSK